MLEFVHLIIKTWRHLSGASQLIQSFCLKSNLGVTEHAHAVVHTETFLC
jgi:hypothetical protein